MKKKIPDPDKMKKIKGPKLSKKELKGSKIKVTTYLDEEVLKVLREMAEKSGGKYQTLLNKILRDILLDDKKGILQRLEELEKVVFKGKAA